MNPSDLNLNRLASFIDEHGIGGAQIFRNRLRLREGPGAIDAEHLGGLTAGVHSTMLYSETKTPGAEPLLKIFNGWPKDWDAAFTLRAPGAFLVSAAQQTGKVRFVQIKSLAGAKCRLVNPWPDTTVALYRADGKSHIMRGETLSFDTHAGESLLLAPEGISLSHVRVPFQ